MFEPIHLWEVGILLIGVAFIVVAIYLSKTLKELTVTVEGISKVVTENRKQIDDIIVDVKSITGSSSGVMDTVEETVNSAKKTVSDVGKTVSTTKNYLLKPTLKGLKFSHSAITVALALLGGGRRKQKQKKQK